MQSLSGLLEGGSLILNERGDIDPIPRHKNFRVFACMNPPTDIGKKVTYVVFVRTTVGGISTPRKTQI